MIKLLYDIDGISAFTYYLHIHEEFNLYSKYDNQRMRHLLSVFHQT